MRLRERNTIEKPIDDLVEALGLLTEGDYRSGGYLCLNYRRRGLKSTYKGPRIVRQHMGGAYDMEVVAEDVYFLTERLATALQLDGFTRGTPHMGYTDEHERHPTDFARNEHWRMYQEREEKENAKNG